MRATASMPPPARNGTTSVSGRGGKLCARAASAAASMLRSMPMHAAATLVLIIIRLPHARPCSQWYVAGGDSVYLGTDRWAAVQTLDQGVTVSPEVSAPGQTRAGFLGIMPLDQRSCPETGSRRLFRPGRRTGTD